MTPRQPIKSEMAIMYAMQVAGQEVSIPWLAEHLPGGRSESTIREIMRRLEWHKMVEKSGVTVRTPSGRRFTYFWRLTAMGESAMKECI